MTTYQEKCEAQFLELQSLRNRFKKIHSLAFDSLEESGFFFNDRLTTEDIDSAYEKEYYRIHGLILQNEQLTKELSLAHQVILEMETSLSCCKSDYWFMSNLLERYSSNIEESVKDCIYRMNFRMPIFNILTKHADYLARIKK